MFLLWPKAVFPGESLERDREVSPGGWSKCGLCKKKKKHKAFKKLPFGFFGLYFRFLHKTGNARKVIEIHPKVILWESVWEMSELGLPRQTWWLAPLFDAEFPWAIWASQGGESLVGYWRCSRYELEQPQPPFIVQLIDGGPKPDDNWVGVVIPRPVKRRPK